MPKLEDYVIVRFDQMTILKSDYLIPERHKPQVAAGVCAALVIEYYKRIEKGEDPDKKMVENLEDVFSRVNIRQEIFETAAADTKDLAGGFNAMSHQTGLQFTNLSPNTTTGEDKEAIKSRLRAAALGDYALNFCGPWGSNLFVHVIAVRIVAGPTYFVFDPNAGIMKAPGNEIDEFVDRFCEQYLEAGIDIQEFWLLRIDKVQTAREKFERGIPVPQVQPTKKS
jgi:hypothetical protein